MLAVVNARNDVGGLIHTAFNVQTKARDCIEQGSALPEAMEF